jgi:hypothetical protein
MFICHIFIGDFAMYGSKQMKEPEGFYIINRIFVFIISEYFVIGIGILSCFKEYKDYILINEYYKLVIHGL